MTTVVDTEPVGHPSPPAPTVSIAEFRRFVASAIDVLEADWPGQAELPTEVTLEDWWIVYSEVLVPELLLQTQVAAPAAASGAAPDRP